MTGMFVAAGMHRFTQMERVIHGRPVAQALDEEMALLGSKRVCIVTTRSVVAAGLDEHATKVLGARHAGTYAGVTAHSPRQCVIDIAAQASAVDADLLLAIGGGSAIDAAKAALMALRYGYTTPEQLEPHANRREPDLGRTPSDAAQWCRVLAVPTTLSGAEFASSAGLTDPQRAIKQAFTAPMMMPVSVILDPAMTRATPLRLMLGTGIKAVDHATERVTSAFATPFSDAVSLLALRLLAQALPRIAADPQDLAARADAQYGMFMSLAGSATGAMANVSHAIGHVLGAHAGVPHGETSCVMLPAVLRWNADATVSQQRAIAQALGTPESSAADGIERLVRSLGLPTRLSEVGVTREAFAAIAGKTMHEHLLRASRKPVPDPQTVEQILNLAE